MLSQPVKIGNPIWPRASLLWYHNLFIHINCIAQARSISRADCISREWHFSQLLQLKWAINQRSLVTPPAARHQGSAFLLKFFNFDIDTVIRFIQYLGEVCPTTGSKQICWWSLFWSQKFSGHPNSCSEQRSYTSVCIHHSNDVKIDKP